MTALPQARSPAPSLKLVADDCCLNCDPARPAVRECAFGNLNPCDMGDQVCEFVDGYETILAQVERLPILGAHQFLDPGNAIINVAKRAGLVAISPDLDFMVPGVFGDGNLAAHRRGRFSRPPFQVP